MTKQQLSAMDGRVGGTTRVWSSPVWGFSKEQSFGPQPLDGLQSSADDAIRGLQIPRCLGGFPCAIVLGSCAAFRAS